MENFTSCQQFMHLIELYKLNYICTNYNVNCDNYCMTDVNYNNNYNCYCYCDNDQIYCINSYHYYSRLFSVLFVGLLFSSLCCMCYNIFYRKKIEIVPQSKYDDLKNNNYLNNINNINNINNLNNINNTDKIDKNDTKHT